MSSPLVSITVPCYNHERYVQQCITSIIEQDYDNIELIIIDDGSSDQSVKKIEELIPVCEQRFARFKFRSRENKGLSATLNEALAWTNGKYFSVLASDDVILCHKISTLVKALESAPVNFAVAFGDAAFIDEKGERLLFDPKSKKRVQSKQQGTGSFLTYYSSRRGIDIKNDFGSYKTILEGNYLPAMGYLLKRSAIDESEFWTEGNRIEDWEMWLKLSKEYNFINVNRTVSLYRLHIGNTIQLSNIGLLKDSLVLLEKEKKYALEHGFHDTFYRSKIYLHLAIIYKDIGFIRQINTELFDLSYIYNLLVILLKRLIKLTLK